MSEAPLQVSLGGAEAVGDAGLFLKLLTFFGDANRSIEGKRSSERA
jgi:hypothetical protein